MQDINNVIWPSAPFNLMHHSILVGYRGSQAHGTYRPNTDPNSIDDIDLMAVVVPPRDYYFGTKQWDTCEAINDPWDVVAYELKKFIGLLVKQNPNVLTMLWLEPDDYLLLNRAGKLLIKNREVFSSRDCLEKFVGYALGQLNRMTHIAGRGYLGAKRKKLVEKHGFDTKNASHLMRLLHMGIEFLSTGQLNVRRTWDRQMLLDIKDGKYDLVAVNAMAAEAFTQIEDAGKQSKLPKHLDMNAINSLSMQVFEEAMSPTGWIVED